jgi:hypothetical protein
MWSVNWTRLLHHPSEIVRLDEQLRLKTLNLYSLKERIFPTLSDQIESHLNLIHNFRCYLYIEATKYFNVQLMSQSQFEEIKTQSAIKANEAKSLQAPPHPQKNFSNMNQKELDLFLLISSDIKNTENIFKKIIFRFLAENYPVSSFGEKSALANVIMTKCVFSLE